MLQMLPKLSVFWDENISDKFLLSTRSVKHVLQPIQLCETCMKIGVWIIHMQSTWNYSAKVHADMYLEGWAQDYCNSNIFLKPLFRGNLDPFVNNANLGAIAHTSNGT